MKVFAALALAGLMVSPVLAQSETGMKAATPAEKAQAGGAVVKMSTATAPVYMIKVETMKEASITTVTGDTLAPYKGKVLLIVNVASKCGYTPQYTGLEALYKKYDKQGLQLVGFPSNDFGGQEPGSEKDIVEFCESKYSITFPLYAKLHAATASPAELYKYLDDATEDKGAVKWNFEKFLIGRDGKVVARFRSKVTPEDPKLVAAIEAELAKPAPTAMK